MGAFSSFLTTIILLGAIQGFIISTLLFSARKLRTPNRILAMLILLMSYCSMNICADLYQWTAIKWVSFICNFIPRTLVMPIGPLIWFYVRAFSDPSFTFSKKDRLHFVPVIIDLVPPLVVIGFVMGVWAGWLPDHPQPVGTFIDTYNVYSDIPRWLSVTAYLLLSVRYLKTLKANAGNTSSQRIANPESMVPATRWLHQFVYVFLGFQVIWLAFLVPYVIPRYTDWMLNSFDWYPVYAPLALLIYFLGIKGYVSAYQFSVVSKRTEAASLPGDTVSQSLALLTRAMETDHLYLREDLTLNVLSEHTGLAPKTISAVLNQHVGKNFNEYVNAYRVAAFKEKMSQPGAAQFTIAGLAYECGFSSLATFQRTFRQVAGMSPSEFRKQANTPQITI